MLDIDIVSINRGLDEYKELFKLVFEEGGFISGGYAIYCLAEIGDHKFSDIDIFFKTPKTKK